MGVMYEYKAIEKSNVASVGVCFAEDSMDLFRQVELKGLILVSYNKKKLKAKKAVEKFSLPFFRSLYQLIFNNIELMAALNIVLSSMQSKESKAIIENIISNISNGLSFSKSLAKFEKYFDLLVVKTIEIAEKTAGLSDALKTIIEYLEFEVSVKNKIKNSTRYPIILLSAVMCVALFWVFFIVPTFANLFSDIGIEMPVITKAILSFRSFCMDNSAILLAALLGSVVYLLFVFKYEGFKRHKQIILQKLPLLKKAKRDSMVLNFFSGMYVMLKEKVNLIDALDCISSLTCSEDIRNIKDFIKNGDSISKAIRRCGVFKDSEVVIIEAGEKAGDLWPAFKTAQDLLKTQINDRSGKIISLIQPMTILFIGGILLIIVYSVLIPMYSKLEIGS